MNIGNRSLLAILRGNKQSLDPALSLGIAGTDIIFLAWTGAFYFILVFIIEKISHKGEISRFFSKEQSVLYQPKPLDDGKLSIYI